MESLRRRTAGLVAAILLLTGCGGGAAPTQTAPTPTGPPADALALACRGEGGPTVVFSSGLDTGGDAFSALALKLQDRARLCTYDRAGVGSSPPLAAGGPDPWPGSAADGLAHALDDAGEEPPYVVVGWSYGGMVAQAFATRHPELTAGLVLEDSAVPQQFVDHVRDGDPWVDGGREVDEEQTIAELSEVDFGALPVVVLTQDELPSKLAGPWLRYQDRLAASSSNAVHLRAVRSGHEIHVDAESLELAAITEVVAAAAAGTPLAACDDRFADRGGRCL
jgi:pimeloyl-ACP methyl ester carboxylesterase